MAEAEADRRQQVLTDYRKKLLKHKEIDTKVRGLRDSVKDLKKEYDKTEDDLKALQSVGQVIGEVLRQLDEERCEWAHNSSSRDPLSCLGAPSNAQQCCGGGACTQRSKAYRAGLECAAWWGGQDP
jgi:26S proteasome regulatory subunit T4